jgi:hypothetical protein
VGDYFISGFWRFVGKIKMSRVLRIEHNTTVADGGWFCATTAGLTSDSSEYESESDLSTSDNVGLSKLQRKHGVKIKAPFTYDGRADLDVFDQRT